MDGILNDFATEELPSTKKSAPLINNINPTNNKTIDFSISIIHILSFFIFHFLFIPNRWIFLPKHNLASADHIQ